MNSIASFHSLQKLKCAYVSAINASSFGSQVSSETANRVQCKHCNQERWSWYMVKGDYHVSMPDLFA